MNWIRTAVLVLVLATNGASASGKEISIGEKEQVTIAQICEIAARSPSIGLEVTAGVASWCVQWGKRVNEQAVLPVAPAEIKAPEEKK